MKNARLHNGVELTFPDITPDKVIDKTVKNFLAIKEETSSTANPMPSMLAGLFVKIENRFQEIRNAIGSIPEPPTPEKIDLKPLENSMEASEDNLAKIIEKLAPIEKNSADIAGQIESLLRAVADINPSHSIDSLKKEITAIAKSIEKSFNGAIRDSQEKFRSQLLAMFENHASAIKKIVDNSTASVVKTSQENTLVVVDAITAPKEIIFDKKTGRPLGVKIKE